MDSQDLEVVKLAIMAAGQVGSDERGWNLRVAQLAMQIGALLRPPAPEYENLATSPVVVARKVLDADVYRAEFVSFSEEEMERNHRLLVRIRPEHGKPKYLDAEGCEWIRTEPRWTSAGFVMQRLIRNLAPSTPVLIYKYVEGFTSKGQGDEDDEDKKSRVLAHIEVTGKPKNAPHGEAGGSAPARSAPGAHGGAGRNPSPAGTTNSQPEENPAIAERFAKLSTTQQIAYMRSCRGREIAEPMNPGPEDIDAALIFLTKIERGEPVT